MCTFLFASKINELSFNRQCSQQCDQKPKMNKYDKLPGIKPDQLSTRGQPSQRNLSRQSSMYVRAPEGGAGGRRQSTVSLGPKKSMMGPRGSISKGSQMDMGFARNRFLSFLLFFQWSWIKTSQWFISFFLSISSLNCFMHDNYALYYRSMHIY